MGKKVMVAMSGGVDSSVAALLLKEQGWDVVGVTMCFNIASGANRRPSCCGLEGIEDARKVARQINIPHYVLNFAADLEKAVIRDFVDEYAAGRTPNPCVRCNQRLKFASLLKKGRAMGIGAMATGHFARIGKRGRALLLRKGIDAKKDQSYFLCQVSPQDLSRAIFPLGELTKDQVRSIARRKGLCIADKPGSQEVCFIPANDYREFLTTRFKKGSFARGDIVDKDGKVLGRHEGLFHFTIGQREGLGISAAHPLYVIALDAGKNEVVVGPKADLSAEGLVAGELNVFVKTLLKKNAHLSAKIRYNHPDAAARLRSVRGEDIEVLFDQPVSAVTPGQFVVLYRGDVVVAGAKIIRERR